LILAIRADAGVIQGTGHVMRCLSLAERLLQLGHRVGLFTNDSKIDWLEAAIESSGVEVFRVQADHLEAGQFEKFSPDWLIVDSYQIPGEQISLVTEKISTLAIIDGNTRGIVATEYLDTNLFAEKLDWPNEVRARLLAGSNFALVRDAVLSNRRGHPELLNGDRAKILIFLGGSDPYGFSPLVASALAKLEVDFEATFVVPAGSQDEVAVALGKNADRVTVIDPTPTLATLYRDADVVVSAAGTSAWDVCSLGIPSLLLAVVDNQEFSLNQIAENGLTLTNNLAGENSSKADELAEQITALIADQDLRIELSKTALHYFDGLGRDRVEEFLRTNS
jgi:spore coat polysaccharide biosynthesis predicted glycosyltransferase SpsG